jgi:hypothetical protein
VRDRDQVGALEALLLGGGRPPAGAAGGDGSSERGAGERQQQGAAGERPGVPGVSRCCLFGRGRRFA